MLHIVESNKQELLLHALQAQLHQKREIESFEFGKQVVIAQNVGMQRWLTLELAKKQGISAGLEFDFPLRFIWNLFKKVCDFNSDELIASRKEYVQTRLFDLLQQKQNHATIQRFLATKTLTDKALKLWDLAAKLASLFDEYELFRTKELPNKILSGKQENDWQFELLYELTQSKNELLFRHESQLQLIDRLRDASVHLNYNEIHVYAIPTLPEATLRSLLLLAKQPDTDVFWYMLKPSDFDYWHILDKAQIPDHAGNIFDFLESSSLEGREQASWIYRIITEESIPSKTKKMYDSIKSESYSQLEAFQQAVLTNKTHLVSESDKSIQIHSNYSPQREVEVLRDFLLQEFAENPDLKPGEILVMSSNIDVYAPHIEYFFNEELHQSKIPYSIADTKFSLENEYVQALLHIFELLLSNLKRTDLLDFLRRDSVKKKWNLDEAAVNRITGWILQTHTLFGWESESEQPDWGSFTFEKLRDTLFKSLFYLTGENQLVDERLIPMTLLTQDEIETWAIFERFLKHLFLLHDTVQEHKTVQDWLTFSIKVLHQFIDEGEQSRLTQKLSDMKSVVEAAHGKTLISAEHFIRFLNIYVDDSSAGSGFLQGKVTCCAMVPLRSLPFKYICLLGLNEGQFPGKKIRSSFDWLEQEPKPGDRDRRKDDEYLFLESVISTRKKLYLSYVGRSIKDDSIFPKSALVQQFADAVTHFTGHTPFEKEHTLYAHNQQNFTGDSTSLNVRAFEVLKHSNYNQVLDSIHSVNIQHSEKKTNWELNEWLKFVENPPVYMLHKEAGIAAYRIKEELTDHELFSKDGLDAWNFNELVFNLLVEHPQLRFDDLFPIIREKGLIHAGFDSRESFERDAETIYNRLKYIQEEIWKGDIPALSDFTFQADELSIQGSVWFDLSSGLYVYHTFSQFNTKHQIRAYLTACLLAESYQQKIRIQVIDKTKVYNEVSAEPDDAFLKVWLHQTEHRLNKIPLFHVGLSTELYNDEHGENECITDYISNYNSIDSGVLLALQQLGKKTDWELIEHWRELAGALSLLPDFGSGVSL
ncbi:hypothetical protein EP331_06070 [bacterium]|nr:MAG: hypothetical protein EP331_06070 [bacterium]